MCHMLGSIAPNFKCSCQKKCLVFKDCGSPQYIHEGRAAPCFGGDRVLPCQGVTSCSSTIHSRHSVASMSRASCVTTTTPPLN